MTTVRQRQAVALRDARLHIFRTRNEAQKVLAQHLTPWADAIDRYVLDEQGVDIAKELGYLPTSYEDL